MSAVGAHFLRDAGGGRARVKIVQLMSTAGKPTRTSARWLNWPNRISLFRILLIVPFVICLLKMNDSWPGARRVVLVIFAVMALSDVLDGYLARRLKQDTPLGKFLDPLADKLLITCTVILLAIDGVGVPGFLLPDWVPVIAISKDALIVIGFVLVAASTRQYFIKPRIWGKMCTLLQSCMVVGVLLAPDLPKAWQAGVPALWWLASLVAVIAVVDYFRIGNRFAAEHHAKTHHDR